MAKPKYTENKMKGNIGEAFVQYVLSEFCLVHKIDGSNDVGNDMICELIKEEYPTNLLFYVQVKYTNRKPTIRKETLEYWKESPIPVYLFWLRDDKRTNYSLEKIDFQKLSNTAKYKRFTPIAHGTTNEKEELFKHFKQSGFLKDLITDYALCEYTKGFTPVISPRDFLALDQKNEIGFPRYILNVEDMMPKYRDDILKHGWSSLFGIAVSLYKEWQRGHNEEDRKLALEVMESAKKLLLKNPELYNRFIGDLNNYERRMNDPQY